MMPHNLSTLQSQQDTSGSHHMPQGPYDHRGLGFGSLMTEQHQVLTGHLSQIQPSFHQ
jgi:hypothetical protein